MSSDPKQGHDLFISYAHVDNPPLFGAEQGWVSTLVRDLRNLLAQKLGRREDVSIWWDKKNLLGNHEITPEIRTKIQRSATLLLVLSPGYLKSRWCNQEMDLFFKTMGGKSQGRVFVVEMQCLDEDQSVPSELADIKGYRFWYKDERERPRTRSIHDPEPKKTEYTQMVEDLAHDISRKLKALATDAPTAPPESKATVFLAEVTDDMEPRREQVRRYLEQADIRVLPARRHLEGQSFKDALKEDLAQSGLFVQLLGKFIGKRPPGISQGYARLQLEQAQALPLPILQWRDPALVMDEVESEQKELLEAETVHAEPMETFKQGIVRQAIPPPPPPAPERAVAPVVFINFERRDRALAETIRDHVDKRLMAILPVSEGAASDVREDLEQKLKDCDALIVVYGERTLAWVDKQLLYCNKIVSDRDQYFRALGVYDGPPEDKQEVSTRMPGLEILPCRKGLDGHRLQAFLAPLLKSVEP